MHAEISVIVPVYNAEKYLSRCIESILGQTMAPTELILVDDGSTDNSGTICDRYAERNPHVRTFHRENRGPANARNFAVGACQGDYILFVDADDYLESDACEILNRHLVKTKSDCVIFGIFRENISHPDPIAFELPNIEKAILAGDTAGFTQKGYYFDATWGKLYKTSVIREHQIRFPECLKRSEDAVFSLYYYENAKKITLIGDCLYHYEVNPESISNFASNVNVKMLPLVLQENDAFICTFHPKDESYAAANRRRVFSGMSEAENRYFFHPDPARKLLSRYKEFKALLYEPIVRSHILALKRQDLKNRNQSFKRLLYRYPLFLPFALYYFIQKEKIK